MSDGSKVIRCVGFRWEGIPVTAYRADGSLFQGVTRQTILGEDTEEGGFNFITRYFEIGPGGYSTLERHQHPHSVVVLRGRGQVVLDGEEHEIVPFDCVAVGPGTPHQFRAAADEPLGFLCVVDRVRDRPVPVT